jgi:hypothetical protein
MMWWYGRSNNAYEPILILINSRSVYPLSTKCGSSLCNVEFWLCCEKHETVLWCESLSHCYFCADAKSVRRSIYIEHMPDHQPSLVTPLRLPSCISFVFNLSNLVLIPKLTVPFSAERSLKSHKNNYVSWPPLLITLSSGCIPTVCISNGQSVLYFSPVYTYRPHLDLKHLLRRFHFGTYVKMLNEIITKLILGLLVADGWYHTLLKRAASLFAVPRRLNWWLGHIDNCHRACCYLISSL